MLDAALIEKCADPSMKPAIVEQFVNAAGSTDPLAITVRSGDRIILVPKPANEEDALAIIRENVAHSVVRVGVTQLPVGPGAGEVADLKPDLVDTCENLKMGTRMFAKVMRIVANWYGNPKSDEVFPQIVEDALHAWITGYFEGESVFHKNKFDSGRAPLTKADEVDSFNAPGPQPDREQENSDRESATGGNSDMRIDLTRIGGGQ